MEINLSTDRTGEEYIITDILGDGKFKALTKVNYQQVQKIKSEKGLTAKEKEQSVGNLKELESLKETFDISVKKSPYQLGIKLTEEVKAKIRGEAPEFQASGKQF